MSKAEERQAFLDRIKEDPYDSTNRLIFSDWLEEYGEDKDHEEAIEQRRCSTPEWKEAREWLLNVYLPPLQENERYYDRDEPADLEELIQAAHNFLDTGESGTLYLSFDTPDSVYDYREEFWKQFEIYTGRNLDGDYEQGTFVRCAC